MIDLEDEGYDDEYVYEILSNVSKNFLLCTDYVEEQEQLVYRDGLKHGGQHQDWLDQTDRDLEADMLALIRHLEAYRRGELVDPDSGAHPLAHVRARCGIIMDVERKRTHV